MIFNDDMLFCVILVKCVKQYTQRKNIQTNNNQEKKKKSAESDPLTLAFAFCFLSNCSRQYFEFSEAVLHDT